MNGRTAPDWATLALAALAVMGLFAVSRWTSLLGPNGAVFVGWVLAWAVGSGVVAARWRHWSWPLLCTGSMLAPWLLWTAFNGRAAWQSQFVFLFAAVHAIAADIGATLGSPSADSSGAGRRKRTEPMRRSHRRLSLTDRNRRLSR